jgi:flavodoxin
MRAIVVYESMFGNTQRVARAISDGLRSLLPVDEFEVGVAPHEIPDGIDLIVMGGPTHAWGMSRAKTREGLHSDTGDALVSPGIGLREWLEAVQPWSHDIAVAVFDTRFDKPRWLTGSAARSVEKRLARKGILTLVATESFFVTGTKGPLVDGETERARKWAQSLARTVADRGVRAT